MAPDAVFAALREPLEAGLLSLRVDASPDQIDRMIAYLALIGRWNRVYNLTAVREPAEMLTHHLLDSLSVLPSLNRRLPPAKRHRLLDVGSGAGLPGVVIALLRPDLEVICVDAVAKKCSFVRQVAGELGLANLHAEHARVESLAAAPFDVITSRAFASLADFVRLTAPLLAPGGLWMAMKGRVPEDELAALPEAVALLEVEPLQVPGLDAERCLVWMSARC